MYNKKEVDHLIATNKILSCPNMGLDTPKVDNLLKELSWVIKQRDL